MRFIVVLYADRVLIARSCEIDVIRKTIGVLRISQPLSLINAIETASLMRKKIQFTKKAIELIDKITGITD